MITEAFFNKILDYRHPLEKGHAPKWANGWGEDQFGPFVEIRVGRGLKRIIQRLRWIPPGQFMMGSPEDEAGRDDNEGPQHRVTITKGFWLFDTPVTQAMWQAVMGENPSEFQSPKRPVENVSWHDAHTFMEKMNQVIPGLNLSLPTEAQWEFACRANSETATYNGEMTILGQCNAPVLDEIAWYGGNSGVNFDLENGDDISWVPEKQYEFNMAGSRNVAMKEPNDWGLYDMLGNVLEWCGDDRRIYEAGAEIDPVGPPDGAFCVLRGGGWIDGARYVRAAFRFADDPSGYGNFIGFRCALVQEE